MSPQFPCYNRRPSFGHGGEEEYDATMVTKLLNNYRSHPAIIEVWEFPFPLYVSKTTKLNKKYKRKRTPERKLQYVKENYRSKVILAYTATVVRIRSKF